MSGSRARMPNKTSLTLRSELERRGIDLLEMQLAVYTKSMAEVDRIMEKNARADEPKLEKVGDHDEEAPDQESKNTYTESAVGYLSICNQAVATLARYCYPTMAAVQVQNMDKEVNEKVIDATEVRAKILADPFAAQVAHKATTQTDTGLPILLGGKKDE